MKSRFWTSRRGRFRGLTSGPEELLATWTRAVEVTRGFPFHRHTDLVVDRLRVRWKAELG